MGRHQLGFLRYGNGRAAAPCIVHHATAFGVRFETATPLDLDGEFDIRIGDQAVARRGRIVRRQGTTVMAELRPVQAERVDRRRLLMAV
jgi:hypothetical protein